MSVLAEYFRATPTTQSNELFGFLDGGEFMTWSGDVGACLKLDGVDCECREEGEIAGIAKRLDQAFRIFGPEYRVYQYLFREKRGSFYTLDLFIVILRMRNPPKGGLRSARKYRKSLEKEVEQTIEGVRQAAGSFVNQTEGLLSCRTMNPAESHKLFSRMLNFDAAVLESIGLDFMEFLGNQVCNSVIDNRNDGFIRVGESYVQVLTLSQMNGDNTFPSMVEMVDKLQGIKGNFFLCSEWNELVGGRGIVNKARKIINRFKTSGGGNGEKGLVDEGDQLDVDELGEGQKKVRKGGNVGHYRLTAVVHGQSQEEMAATQREVERVLRESDCKARPETYNQLAAFLACVPGSYKNQVRQLGILNGNHTDLGFWHAPAAGNKINEHLNAPCLMTLRTKQGTRFNVNFHVGDVGHVFTVGDTGTGKSFFNNLVIDLMMERYNPFMLICDKGGSFRWTTQAHGGKYFQISPETFNGQFTLNPFACDPTDRNVEFLKLFTRVLMEQNSTPLTAEELQQVSHEVDELFHLGPSDRQLSTLAMLLRKLGKRLERWCDGGQFSWVFDHPEDTLNLGDLQCFEFAGTDQKEGLEILEPLLLTIIHRANSVLYDTAQISRLKVFCFGELWQFLQNPAIETYIGDLLRTGRKNNGIAIMESQSPLELFNSRIREVILGACHTRIYLTSQIDAEKYGTLLDLNSKMIERIGNLTPKGQILFHQPRLGIAKVLNVEATERQKALASNDPRYNALRQGVIREHGEEIEKWLPVLVGANGGKR